MPWMEILSKIFEVCIIPLLGVLTTYFIVWMRAKSKALQEQSKSELQKKYLAMLEDTISNCVIATNQTYVEALKEQGAFGLDEQKIAFSKTFLAVADILTEEAKVYLCEAVGDLNEYITTLIEAKVNENK